MEPIIIKTDIIKDMIVQCYVNYKEEICFRFIKIYLFDDNSVLTNSVLTYEFHSIEDFINNNNYGKINIFIIPNEFNFCSSFHGDRNWSSLEGIFDKNTKLKLEEMFNAYMLFL